MLKEPLSIAANASVSHSEQSLRRSSAVLTLEFIRPDLIRLCQSDCSLPEAVPLPLATDRKTLPYPIESFAQEMLATTGVVPKIPAAPPSPRRMRYLSWIAGAVALLGVPLGHPWRFPFSSSKLACAHDGSQTCQPLPKEPQRVLVQATALAAPVPAAAPLLAASRPLHHTHGSHYRLAAASHPRATPSRARFHSRVHYSHHVTAPKPRRAPHALRATYDSFYVRRTSEEPVIRIEILR